MQYSYRKRTPVRLAGVAAVVLLGLAALPRPAHALVETFGCAAATFCTMSELANHGAIRVNDKVFSDWTVDPQSFTGTARPAELGAIIVSGLDDGGLDPGPGLRYSPGDQWTVISAPGEGGQLTIGWSYFVRVDNSRLAIKDHTLYLGATVDHSTIVGGGVRLSESLRTSVGKIALFGETCITSFSSDPTVACDSTTFPPQPALSVTTRLIVGAPADEGNTAARVFEVAERFSQVPEPGTLGLVSLGIVGLGFVRRSRKA